MFLPSPPFLSLEALILFFFSSLFNHKKQLEPRSKWIYIDFIFQMIERRISVGWKVKSHLFLDFQLSVWLVQPAVKVWCQEHRFPLLHTRSFPPASLLLLDSDIYLPLGGPAAYLDIITKQKATLEDPNKIEPVQRFFVYRDKYLWLHW